MTMNRVASLCLAFIMIIMCAAGSITVNAADDESTMNLVAGLQYTITTGEPVENSYLNYEPDKFGVDNGQLTDGVTAMTDYNSAAWYCSMRGASRIVTFDLGKDMLVTGFYAGFLHIKSMAIYAPRYVNVRLSLNGTDYQTVLNTKPDFDLTVPETRRADIEKSFKVSYKARYVQIEFCTDIFVYCDEIKIFGQEKLTGKEAVIKPDAPKKESDYLKSIGGVKNIIKIYNGYYPEQSIADNTKEKLLPYVAYVDSNNRYTDTMFDAVAFVPCHTDYPSGGRLVKTNGKPGAVMSDWLLYLENTFQQGLNVDALNQTVGEVCSQTGKKGKMTVYFTLPFPTVIEGPFGDINGDKKPEYCRTLDERSAILKWYINLTYENFIKGNYSNLSFGGFYWYREGIDYSETNHEAELVTKTGSYLSKRGFKYLFDPFFLSVGYDKWKELGFDGAVMQPNLVFNDYFKTEMLSEFADILKNNNLGVEMETAEPSSFRDDDYKKFGLIYENYLYYGWKHGYMDALKTFYQGAGPGSLYDFCYSSSSSEKGQYLRSLYDKTYKFLKGTYTALPPVVEIADFETTKGQKNVRVPIKITDEDTLNTDLTVIFTKLPEHGTVTALSNNKTIIFTADEDYTGKDSFELKVYDKFSYSEPITVNVNVVDVTNESLSGSFSGEETVPIIVNNKDNRFIAIGISIASVFICVSACILLVKIKKRK